MSETVGVNVAKRAMNLEVSPQFDGYSAVRIYVGTDEDGNDIVYEAGDTNGRVLEIQNDFGTQEMADNILSDIRGYQYQPMSATAALLNPAAEMGDGVSVNGVYTGIYERQTTFGRLMSSDIKAPTDDEIAHEYSTESATTDRAFSRFVRSTRASLAITSTEISAEVSRATAAEETLRASLMLTADQIAAEVTRATAAEGTLSSRITQTSNSISSEVTRAKNAESNLSSQITQTASSINARVTAIDNSKLSSTRTNSSFGWSLTASGFYLNSNGNTRIFEANSSGIKISGNADITGKITATSGYIGNGSQGFQIRASSITNGKSSLYDDYDGVYIGTDGIALGRNFRVDSSGNVTASSMKATNMELDGWLTIGGELIDADTLRQGAEYAFSGHDDWDWSAGEVSSNGTYWSNGADAGTDAKSWTDKAGDETEGVWVLCSHYMYGNEISASEKLSVGDGANFYFQGYRVYIDSISDGDGNYHSILAVGW